jgi:GTP-binding protein
MPAPILIPIMFTDRVKLEVLAGKGGDGAVAWIRAKYIPKGGPCGGDGGDGGSIILKTSTHQSSLESYRNRKLIKAQDGEKGGSNLCHGKNGEDLILEVPCGTLVKDIETGEVLFDLTEPNQTVVLCPGGKGGKGNDTFKSPTNRAPYQFTPGEPGIHRFVEFELKLIADVGLIGFPNAGKSTLINQVGKLDVKIAPYPFTTLVPNLGFFETPSKERVFIADIPGIIEGAHYNKGLGLEFLRHIERTRLLLFIMDASGIDGRTPAFDFKVLRKELQEYNDELLSRPYLVVLNKIDEESSTDNIADFTKAFPKEKFFLISAKDGIGLDELKKAIISKIK